MKHIVTDKNSILFDDVHYNLTCKSKKAYSTEYHAQYAIDESEAKGTPPLRYYKCPYCKNFHLTSL